LESSKVLLVYLQLFSLATTIFFVIVVFNLYLKLKKKVTKNNRKLNEHEYHIEKMIIDEVRDNK